MKMTVGVPPSGPSADADLPTSRDGEGGRLVQKVKGLRFRRPAVRMGHVGEDPGRSTLSRPSTQPGLRTTGDRKSLSQELIAAHRPLSQRVGQLQAIRGQLMQRWFDRNLQRQVLTIIGTDRGEGRSFLAANLAIVFSQLGKRTLLIDADLREPRQHELFRLRNKTGLSSMLSGRARDEAIVRIPDLAGLFVLPAGPLAPHPLELLCRADFDEVMNQAKSIFDVVIIDTPALSQGEDAARIAVRTGAALAVARSSRTRVTAFGDMVQGLTDAGVAVVGSVLNDVPLTRVAK